MGFSIPDLIGFIEAPWEVGEVSPLKLTIAIIVKCPKHPAKCFKCVLSFLPPNPLKR